MEVKPAAASKSVAIDWTDVLSSGVTISTSAWACFPLLGVTLSAAGVATASAFATAAGGTAGHLVILRNTVTLSNGVIEQRTIDLTITDEAVA